MSNNAGVDVDAEWQAFSITHKKPIFRFLWSGSRAASIAFIAFTSLAAVAIGITVAVKTFAPTPQTIDVEAEPAVARAASAPQLISKDSTEVAETVPVMNTPVLFEDASLEEILSRVAEVHGATVEYKKPETAQLHLYYKFDPTISLKETVGQLNTFEQISIRISGKKIIVD